jgi:shikimate dehydrogenase
MLCAVLGSPIAHSLSPVMHRAAYRELGLDWRYEAVEIAEGGLAEFVQAVGEDVRGFSVTAPLKREAAAVAHQRDSITETLGVANTIVFEDDARLAYNTDVPGGVNALTEAGVAEVFSARILGGGATAASMALTLAHLGVGQIQFVVRDASRAADAIQAVSGRGIGIDVASFDDDLSAPVDVVISTVPSQAVSEQADSIIAASGALFDVIYNPWPTSLAAAAEQAAKPVVSGLDLLAHQAAIQVQLMTGSDIDPDILRQAALQALASR